MIRITGSLAMIIILAGIIAWFGNAYKLVNCAFKAPYACEIVHAVGLIPLAAPVAVFIDPEEAPQTKESHE